MVAVGVDACKGGWVAVAISASDDVAVHFLPTIGGLAWELPDMKIVAIDIPIRLSTTSWREADRAAKSFLGSRGSSVFLTPIRAALEAPTHAEASRRSTNLMGAGISQQAFALRDKVFEVEGWLPAAPCSVFEVHPEVSFAVMTGQPMTASKKTWQGMVDRRAALKAAGIEIGVVDPSVGSRAAVDDVLDAAVAAWSAQRLLAGTAISFPGRSEESNGVGSAHIWA